MRSEEEIVYAIDAYADMVKRICFIHLKQAADVDDVFQDVFLKYANSSSFLNREHEKAWMIRITINACHDFFKSWFHQKVQLSDALEIFQKTAPQEQVNYSLMEALLKLPKKYRDVIYLQYYEGYKINEISDLLKKNPNTIHTWLKRAKEQLKVILGGEWNA